MVKSFYDSYESYENDNSGEIERQFQVAEDYRKANSLPDENSKLVTHPQAIYTSRLLNSYTDSLAFDFAE